MTTKNKIPTKQVRINGKLHKKLRVIAARKGCSIGDLIEEKFTNDK